MSRLSFISLTGCLLPLSTACHHTHAPPHPTPQHTPHLDYSTIEFEPPTFHDTGRSDVVDTVVRRAAELRYCYDRQIHRDPDVGSGEIIVSFDIGFDGDVGLVDVQDRGVDADVALCIASRFRQMQFAPSHHPSERITLPITLTRATRQAHEG